jgi:hypothetical protein
VIIRAEDAPLGVPLWPTADRLRLPEDLVTLAQVEVVQSVRSQVGGPRPHSSAGRSLQARRAPSASEKRSRSNPTHGGTPSMTPVTHPIRAAIAAPLLILSGCSGRRRG